MKQRGILFTTPMLNISKNPKQDPNRCQPWKLLPIAKGDTKLNNSIFLRGIQGPFTNTFKGGADAKKVGPLKFWRPEKGEP